MRLRYFGVFSLLCGASYSHVTCGLGKKCPLDQPCCSQFGECGTGLTCLGACDITNSFNLSSCAPLPTCQSRTFNFGKNTPIVNQAKYFGDADQHAWTTNGQVLPYQDNVLLTMAKGSYGTVISSTRAVWYGKVAATLKTSHGPGVVSAFILMSGTRDEIDYEFIGNQLTNAQTNYYSQGELNYTNSRNISMTNSNENFHTYEIDWAPDEITWSLDGHVGRVLKKQDTFNHTTKKYDYPQTPSIIQLSLWPGGSDMNEVGTVSWAGGPIQWDMKEFKSPGYLYVTLKSISVECYDPPPNALPQKQAYCYKSTRGLEQDVGFTNDKYILSSPDSVGFDMARGKHRAKNQPFPTHIGSPHDKAGGSNGKDVIDNPGQFLQGLNDKSKKNSAAKLSGLMLVPWSIVLAHVLCL